MRKLAFGCAALVIAGVICGIVGASAAGATDMTRVAFTPGGLGVNPGEVSLLSSHVYDYTFADAPADWTPKGGLWTTPTAGPAAHSGPGTAATAPTGCVRCGTNTSSRATSRSRPILHSRWASGPGVSAAYKNPSNMNVTLNGDGANPSSGYSFVVGGNNNTVTRIMRGDKVLAETHDPAFLLPIFEDGFPSTYDFHRKWWAIRARQKAISSSYTSMRSSPWKLTIHSLCPAGTWASGRRRTA